MQVDDLSGEIAAKKVLITNKVAFIKSIEDSEPGKLMPVYCFNIWSETYTDVFLKQQRDMLSKMEEECAKLETIQAELQATLDEALKDESEVVPDEPEEVK